MKKLAWMLIFCLSVAHAQDEQENSTEIRAAGSKSIFKEAAAQFAQGKYLSTIEELKAVDLKLQQNSNANIAELGLSAYWQGISYNRLQDYPKSIESFDKALNYNYIPADLHYEYGQALFASEKYQEARIQFRESLKKKFKRGISLYYIGYVSRELGDRKKAVTFFKAISKLPPAESKDVLQAAEFQIGDVYLEQVEKSKDAFRSVDKYVIPQYRRALALNEESNLAAPIKEKIIELQRKYDLVMFNLVNGRPVVNPPYFARASVENGFDTNVTSTPTETTVQKSRQSSGFTRADVMGRYTFYVENWMSISPELRFNQTYYHNRVVEIYRNDNYLIAPAVRTSFEHSLWKKPASFLLDYEFSQSQRDVNGEKKLVFSSRSHAFSIGERFNFFEVGESTLRLRYRLFDSYNEDSNSKALSFSIEQVVGLGESTLLLFTSYDRTRVEEGLYHTDAITVRGDYIFGRKGAWGTPSIGLMLTSTDPIVDRDNRGRELLFNPNARLSKNFGKRWRGSVKYDYQKNNSKDAAGFAFIKSVYSMDIEYLF